MFGCSALHGAHKLAQKLMIFIFGSTRAFWGIGSNKVMNSFGSGGANFPTRFDGRSSFLDSPIIKTEPKTKNIMIGKKAIIRNLLFTILIFFNFLEIPFYEFVLDITH